MSTRTGYWPRTGQADPLDDPDQDQAAHHPGRGPYAHFQGELAQDHQHRGARVGRNLDHPQEQRDAGWIVDPRLALQDRARATADLSAAEHREHDGGVGGSQRGSQHPGHLPVQAQKHVCGHGHAGRRGERAEHAEGGDVAQGPAQPAGADIHATAEQDHDQRHHGDPLHGDDRESPVEAGPEVGDRSGGDQEDKRRGNGHPVGQSRSQDGQRQATGDEGEGSGEVGDLRQHDEVPTRPPGSPGRSLPALSRLTP